MKLHLPLTIALLTAVASAQGAALLHEPFDTAVNVGEPLNNDPAWTDHDGDTNYSIVRNNLSFTGYITSGKAAATDGQEKTIKTVALSSLESYGTIYMSGLFSANIGSAGWGSGPLNSMGLSDASGNAILSLGFTNGDVTDFNGSHNQIHAWAGEISNINGGGEFNDQEFAVDTAALKADTTYFLVAKFEVTDPSTNTMDVSLLVVEDGSVIPTTEPLAWTATTTGQIYGWAVNSEGGLDSLEVFQGNTPGAVGETNLVDEFRFSTSYSDVLLTPVPEPSAAALLLGALGFAALFRRRR